MCTVRMSLLSHRHCMNMYWSGHCEREGFCVEGEPSHAFSISYVIACVMYRCFGILNAMPKELTVPLGAPLFGRRVRLQGCSKKVDWETYVWRTVLHALLIVLEYSYFYHAHQVLCMKKCHLKY